MDFELVLRPPIETTALTGEALLQMDGYLTSIHVSAATALYAARQRAFGKIPTHRNVIVDCLISKVLGLRCFASSVYS